MRCRCPLSRTLIILLMLAGCGGGSSDGDHDPPVATATPVVTAPTVTPTPSLAAGALDPAFGGTGLVLASHQRMIAVPPHGLRVLPDGTTEVLVIEGDAPARSLHRLRFSPDGSELESEELQSIAPSTAVFGTNGDVWVAGLWVVGGVRSLTRFPQETGFTAGTPVPLALTGANLVPLANGGMLAVGATDEAAALERFRPDGSIDTAFGNNGIVLDERRQRDATNAYATATVGSDGRIFVAGTQFFPGLAFYPIVLAYRETGRLDPSFGRGGILVFPDIGNAGAVLVTPDGGLLVPTMNGLVRLTSNGAVDPRGPLTPVAGISLVLPNGDFLAASGAFIPDEPPRFQCEVSSGGVCLRLALVVSRVAADGTLDQRFGGTGTVITDTPPPNGAQDTGYSAIVPAPAGRLTTAGIVCRAPFVCDVVVARYVDVGD